MADESRILKIEVDAGEAITSIQSLTDANKKLREERKNLNLTTVEGKARVDAINDALDRNNKLIRENSSSLEKNRLNVGNYTKSIQDAVPNLDKFTNGAASAAQGVASTTKASLAFIATPIGAIVAALGLAFGALATYIKGSDEAGDRFAKTTAALGVVFDGLKLIVEGVGKVIFDTLEFLGGVAEKIIGIVNPSAAAAIQAAKDAGKAIADLENEIEDRDNELTVKRAETNAKVLALREQAIKQEGAQKRATIQEAIDLEKALAAEETVQAQKRLDLFKTTNAARIAAGNLTAEQLKKQAELQADVINQQSAGAQATIKFQKEIERLLEAEAKLREEARQRDVDAQTFKDEQLQRDLDRIKQMIDAERAGNEEVIVLNEQLNIKLEEETIAFDERQLDQARKRVAWQKKTEEEKFAIISNSLGQAANLFKRDTAEYRVFATARALMDTYAGANLNLKTYPLPLGGIFAALNIAQGLANVAAINGVQFATGGYTGDGGKYEPKGIVHGGEYVIPKETVSKFGIGYFNRYLPQYADGGYVKNQITQPIDQQAQLASFIRSMPAPVLGYKEFTEFSEGIKFKENATTL